MLNKCLVKQCLYSGDEFYEAVKLYFVLKCLCYVLLLDYVMHMYLCFDIKSLILKI